MAPRVVYKPPSFFYYVLFFIFFISILANVKEKEEIDMKLKNKMKLLLFVFGIFLSLCLNAQNTISEDISRLQDLLNENPSNKKALREISFLYLNKADYMKAIKYGEQLYKVGYDEGDEGNALLYAHICLGQAYLMLGNNKLAYDHLGQAKLLGEDFKKDSALCSVYNGLGLYASNVQKDYYVALDYFFKGIEAAKRSNYKRLYSILLSNISGIYFLKKDSTGLKYALECHDLGLEIEDPYIIYCSATNIAYMYYLMKDYEQASQFIKEAEFTMLQNGFYDQANIYNLYGYILMEQKMYGEADINFRKALDCKEQSKSTSVINSFLGYSKLMIYQNKYEVAVDLLNEGLELSRTENKPIFQSALLKTLSECYENMGKYDEALRIYKEYHQDCDTLYSAEKERAIEEIRTKYDVERQENLLKQEHLELEAKEKKNQLLWVILVCVLCVVAVLYYLYYKKNKLYVTIVNQNRETVRREKLLNDEIAQLKQLASQEIKQEPIVSSSKYIGSSLTNEKEEELMQNLEKLLREERIYTDNLLTKEKVAELLGTNRTYLSQVINERTKQTFTQFINGYRTQEAIRQLSDPNNQIALKSLSVQLGFNSMTTFYNQFQAVTGMTPARYRKTVLESQKDI